MLSMAGRTGSLEDMIAAGFGHIALSDHSEGHRTSVSRRTISSSPQHLEKPLLIYSSAPYPIQLDGKITPRRRASNCVQKPFYGAMSRAEYPRGLSGVQVRGTGAPNSSDPQKRRVVLDHATQISADATFRAAEGFGSRRTTSRGLKCEHNRSSITFAQMVEPHHSHQRATQRLLQTGRTQVYRLQSS